jgi:hypothetical protein
MIVISLKESRHEQTHHVQGSTGWALRKGIKKATRSQVALGLMDWINGKKPKGEKRLYNSLVVLRVDRWVKDNF